MIFGETYTKACQRLAAGGGGGGIIHSNGNNGACGGGGSGWYLGITTGGTASLGYKGGDGYSNSYTNSSGGVGAE